MSSIIFSGLDFFISREYSPDSIVARLRISDKSVAIFSEFLKIASENILAAL